MSIEEIIGFHCAPVLKNIKVANLVAIPMKYKIDFTTYVNMVNQKFNCQDLYFFELCHCSKRRLLLVFRKSALEKQLLEKLNSEFLYSYGYERSDNIFECLTLLRQRIENNLDFPHEIGVFLGYPLEDVKAFIHHKGERYRFCGEWKVYFNESEAIKIFTKFKQCRVHCLSEIKAGKTLDDLVA